MSSSPVFVPLSPCMYSLPEQKEVQTTLQHLQSFHQRGHCGSHPSRLSAEKACFNMHISYKQQPSDQTSAHFRFSFQMIEFYIILPCSIWMFWDSRHRFWKYRACSHRPLVTCSTFGSNWICNCSTVQKPMQQLARFNFNPAHGVPTTVMAAWALNAWTSYT